MVFWTAPIFFAGKYGLGIVTSGLDFAEFFLIMEKRGKSIEKREPFAEKFCLQVFYKQLKILSRKVRN